MPQNKVSERLCPVVLGWLAPVILPASSKPARCRWTAKPQRRGGFGSVIEHEFDKSGFRKIKTGLSGGF
jgi:hypothetical protein